MSRVEPHVLAREQEKLENASCGDHQQTGRAANEGESAKFTLPVTGQDLKLQKLNPRSKTYPESGLEFSNTGTT